MLAGDTQKWLQAEINDDFKCHLNKVIVSFVANTPDRYFELIGSGFIIAALERYALVMTAAHNFHYAGTIQKPRHLHHSSTLPEFQVHRGETCSVDKDKMRAIYLSDQNADLCIINGVSIVPELDIALCLIELQENYNGQNFTYKLDIDSRPPRIGDKIASIGYLGMKIEAQEISIEKQSSFFRMKRKIELRHGRVTGVYNTGLRQIKWPCFETTIPIVGGMSGGPVVTMGAPNSGISVCGVISKDFSPEESFNNFSIPGQSIMAMIWPSVYLPFRREFNDSDDTKESNIIDLIETGIINDLGEAHKNTKHKTNENTLRISRIDQKK